MNKEEIKKMIGDYNLDFIENEDTIEVTTSEGKKLIIVDDKIQNIEVKKPPEMGKEYLSAFLSLCGMDSLPLPYMGESKAEREADKKRKELKFKQMMAEFEKTKPIKEQQKLLKQQDKEAENKKKEEHKERIKQEIAKIKNVIWCAKDWPSCFENYDPTKLIKQMKYRLKQLEKQK